MLEKPLISQNTAEDTEQLKRGFCRVFLVLLTKPGQKQDGLLQRAERKQQLQLRVSMGCLRLKPKLFVLEGAQFSPSVPHLAENTTLCLET